jgi:hypothetical protein
VALRTGDSLVQPAERIARGIVIKFRDRPDGAPACVRVTILTRNGQRAVRTSTSLLLRGCRRSKHHTQDEQQDPMPPHRHNRFAAPNFLGFVQPGPRVAKVNDSRQSNCARAFPNKILFAALPRVLLGKPHRTLDIAYTQRPGDGLRAQRFESNPA